MKKLMKTLIGLALLAGIVFTGVQVAQAAGVEKPSFSSATYSLCNSNGGTWSGSDTVNGTCVFAPGSAGHAAFGGACAEAQSVGWKVVNDAVIDTYCIGSVAAGPGYGKCGNAMGKTDEAAILNTCRGVSVAFDAGACTGKCTVGPNLLNTAKKGLSQLDGEVLGEAYVKLRNPSGGSYKICIPGEGTIYKWVSGAWVAQATQTVDGVSCAWSSGDGNYVLVASSD